MKTMFFIRHGKSNWKIPSLTDRERPLNDRGKRDAPFMARLLQERGVKPDVIISSPAVRAMTTTRFISRELLYPQERVVIDESLYLGTVEDLLSVVHSIQNSVNVAMIVGHNPALTLCADLLSGRDPDNIPTCGVVCIELHSERWDEVNRGSGTIRYFEYPKKYFR
jgi:phosphohistidine phosphatase